jgi:hypothetical protein
MLPFSNIRVLPGGIKEIQIVKRRSYWYKLTFKVLVEEKKGVDRGDYLRAIPKAAEMISNTVEGN